MNQPSPNDLIQQFIALCLVVMIFLIIRYQVNSKLEMNAEVEKVKNLRFSFFSFFETLHKYLALTFHFFFIETSEIGDTNQIKTNKQNKKPNKPLEKKKNRRERSNARVSSEIKRLNPKDRAITVNLDRRTLRS